MSAAPPDRSAVTEWASSGLMHLTGMRDGPPLMGPPGLPSVARRMLADLASVTGSRQLATLNAPELLGERAAAFAHGREGQHSPGGSARMMRARDGWLCVNLARECDRDLLPAWLDGGASDVAPNDESSAWHFVRDRLATRLLGPVVARGRELGLAVAPVSRPGTQPDASRVTLRGRPIEMRSAVTRPVVVDLSSLWAGPLATHLLQLAGARVIKVESTARPDAARDGSAALFDLLNAGKESVGLDFRDDADRARLRRLIDAADIVIEASRPRALRQLGVHAEALVSERPGLLWLSITGYGRQDPESNWIAFGDDAAVAAGFGDAMARLSGAVPIFCGDALADPLTGMHAALEAWTNWRAGGGALLDVSLVGVAARVLDESEDEDPSHQTVHAARSRETGGWEVQVEGRRQAVLAPHLRSTERTAAPLGAHTRAVLEEVERGNLRPPC